MNKKYLYVLRTNTPDELLDLETDDGFDPNESILKLINSFGTKIARVSFLSQIHVGPDSVGGAVERSLSTGEQPVIVVDNLIKASRVFHAIRSAFTEEKKYVIGVSGPPGAGKSEFSAVLGSYLHEAGLPTYILSLDNYYHRVSDTNMEERCRLLEQGGDALLEYLGSQSEIDLDRVQSIATDFKAGRESLELRQLDLVHSKIISENKKQSMRGVNALLVEGTWSLLIEPVDLQIFVMSRPDLTLLRRIKRGREQITPELEQVIALEQKRLKLLCSDADLIIYDDYFIEYPSETLPDWAVGPAERSQHDRVVRYHGAIDAAQNPTTTELRSSEEQLDRQPDIDLADSLHRARSVLHQMVTTRGIIASSTEVANYRRVWARDSVIAGLGGLVARDETAMEGLKNSVNLLAQHAGKLGQIPSNVNFDEQGEQIEVSYGGLAGRIDAIPWYIIGVCHYGLAKQDEEFLNSHREVIEKGLRLMEFWEFNSRGLVYMPQGGDWADEYIFHGYVLLPQLLRLWALQLYGEVFTESSVQETVSSLRRLIEVNYWPLEENIGDSYVYHPHAFERILEGRQEVHRFEASFNPTGYSRQFDFLGNAIAVLLKLGTAEQREKLLDDGQQIISTLMLKICPAFWPPIFEGEPEWHGLSAHYRDKFSNFPFHYHNGGSWPMVSGWWGAALLAENRRTGAEQLLQSLQFANSLGNDDATWEFNECFSSLTGEPQGTTPCAWSASAPLLLNGLLEEQAGLYLCNQVTDQPTVLSPP